MDGESRWKAQLRKIRESLNEQVWFQQLKGKWEELDPQSRGYLRWALVGGAVFFLVAVTWSSMRSVRNLKNELREKEELLSLLSTATDDLRRLRSGAGDEGATPQPWSVFLETTASSAGIDKAGLGISPEKPGKAGQVTQESLFDVTLKHVSLKQVIRFAYYVENGPRLARVRQLSVDTKGDPAGYLDATVAISGYSLKQ